MLISYIHSSHHRHYGDNDQARTSNWLTTFTLVVISYKLQLHYSVYVYARANPFNLLTYYCNSQKTVSVGLTLLIATASQISVSLAVHIT